MTTETTIEWVFDSDDGWSHQERAVQMGEDGSHKHPFLEMCRGNNYCLYQRQQRPRYLMRTVLFGKEMLFAINDEPSLLEFSTRYGDSIFI